ncbi:MAG: hypothetical protein A2268_04985 [Candidatus Raymondbacteria bacterium RifOxyA12_full_50_37]|uniref:Single-stranded DNA-binding protein n=1 Tax=Candidatus Raymondbacteria bacterium RIFOXYD12_FULL_49_13 TaxID=1817890 RepID=A0A1F7FD92_UNCRA|nr:MAG: hypothetical protein A2268_04985 [Candidatus Raymondbacteria bacterium RifOxyA12_full_50_37]OGJ94098.1 MAG: hypothetical protein A2248_12190 [Candidatus Raymondbacteria bacterium RIFOXYA2_FULL_49_16]OGJ96214.1 MAG: hypothetical protein A2350_17430 [Candidatus Raymondbacteria bacterium RifOxyB12_full_50_8]OGJ96923.1 MAG: hypothetical protein A2453_04790 [Candidatus Raymondbacteria bacterium RIFOXYC2_FULL_50_21]OGK04649.1 MAG: hypothetical protein A2519_20955 [Candidatus Raymondbacteria b
MASGVNKAILIGNLGKDPELRYVSTGNAVANFSLATTENFKDKSGQKQSRTTWHNIVIWGKLAEIANQYLKKGGQVYLEGRIDNRSYDDKSGNKRYVSEVVVDMNGKLVLLGGRGGTAGAGDSGVDAGSGEDPSLGSAGNASMPPSGSPIQSSDDLPF